jgi:C4-dicarboxylate-specific signal transduction histidine kinase/CheY-like chemotaxis protein
LNDYGRRAGEHVLDELPFAIWVRDATSDVVLYTNRAFQTLMEVSPTSTDTPSQMCADRFFDRQGSPYPVQRLPFPRALAQGEPVVVDDLAIHRSNGEKVWLRAFANPVRNDTGAVTHVVVAFTDITAEVRAVVERGEVEKHLAVAIHHAPVLLFMLDRKGVLTAADGALLAELDRGRGGMVGQSLFDTYKDHPTVPGNIRRALAGETVSYSIEVRSLSLDVWLGPLRDAAGEVVGAIGVCTDVTESRRLQRRIIQDDRVRAMGTVAASVAHEINNPLTYVLAGLEAAKAELDTLTTELATQGSEGTVSPVALRALERLRAYIAPALTGSDRIRQVTKELNTFARQDDEYLTPIDVAGVARSVIKLVRKEIEARARLIEDLGPSPQVLGNESRLVQVLTNLFINAWQALPQPDPSRQHVIGIRTRAEGRSAVIEIWDSGPGVPPERREEIFEPFVTTKDVGMGTGLGLFVCRNIVNSLQGRISVHESPAGGALFRIDLPAAEPVNGQAHAPSQEVRHTNRVQRPRILIVDDDEEVARALSSRLRGDLFEVRTALSGRQGLDILLADEGLHLVYCDVMMKEFTGIDLYEAVLQKAPHTLPKVVLMTGGAFTDRAQTFLSQHRDCCVQKPFDIVADVRRRLG